MVWTKLVLAGVTAYAAVAESDAYPMIEYWQAGDYRANPLCDASDTKFASKGVSLTGSAPNFPYRKSAGLKNLSNRLKEMYANISRQGSKRFEFEATNRVVTTDYESLLQSALIKAIARRRSRTQSGDTPVGVGAEMCKLLSTKPVESTAPSWPGSVSSSRSDTQAFCNVMKGVAQEIHCQDNYIYDGSSAEVYTSSLFGGQEKMPNPEIDRVCYESGQVGQDPLDLHIQQYRSTPNVIDWSLLDTGEKKVYYLLRQSISHLERYAERKRLAAHLNSDDNAAKKDGNKKTLSIHSLFTDEEIFDYILPEWKVRRVIYTNEVSDTTSLRLPLAVISARSNNNLLLTLRQPITDFDSRFSLYNQLSFKYLYNFTGQLHDGSSTYFQSLISPIIYEIRKSMEQIEGQVDYGRQLERGTAQPILKFTVTAADVPGIGTAAAIGNHISRQFGKSIQVDVVGFGSPYFADKDMMDNLRNNIELRVVQVEGDSTDLVSCPQTLSCDHNDLAIRTGVESGVVYSYAMAHGYVSIPLSYLATTNPAWGSEIALYQLAAIRECGYHCGLALAACGYSSDSADLAKCFSAECTVLV